MLIRPRLARFLATLLISYSTLKKPSQQMAALGKKFDGADKKRRPTIQDKAIWHEIVGTLIRENIRRAPRNCKVRCK